VLVVFARMGTKACEWFDGDLRVDVRGDGATCTVDVTAELGLGMRERIFPPLEYPVTIDEFVRAVERVPDRIRPLAVRAKTAKLLTLGVTAEVRQTSLPPPPVKIAEDSFFTAATLKPARTPIIEGRAPSLPVVMARSSRKIQVATKTSSKPPKTPSKPPKAKSIRPAKPPPLPVVTADAKKKSVRPSKAPRKSGRPSLEARIAHVEDEEEIDSGWDDE
jgi:hypothetical protein